MRLSIIAIFLVHKYICVDLSICNIDEYCQARRWEVFRPFSCAISHPPSSALILPLFFIFAKCSWSQPSVSLYLFCSGVVNARIWKLAVRMSMWEWIRQWDASISTPITHDYTIHWWMHSRSSRYSSDARWRSTRYYLFCCRCGDIYHRFHGLRRRVAGEHMPAGRGKRTIGFD